MADAIMAKHLGVIKTYKPKNGLAFKPKSA